MSNFFSSIIVLTVALVGCSKSGLEDTKVVENHSNDEKMVFTKEEATINNGTVWHFEEELESVMSDKHTAIACLSSRTDARIQAETERTKKRLSESSEVFWSLSGLVNDNEPSFFVGGKATSLGQVPDYICSYFREVGFYGEPNLIKLIKAYKNGDRKAADLVERLVLYSGQQVNLIGEFSLLAYSPRRGDVIIGTHGGKWLIFDYETFMDTVPFAPILFEDYLRTISDGLYSCCTNYGFKEIEYLEKQYDKVLRELKAVSRIQRQ